MRETPRDSKWIDERENNDRRRDEYAVSDALEEENSTGPKMLPGYEAQLVTISLLMRIYDVQSALLHHFAPDKADEIYDAHSEGGHFNPAVFIPKAVDED